MQSPQALAELLGNYLTVAFISNIVHTISDLFHVSLARKRERFLRLEGNKNSSAKISKVSDFSVYEE